jgi:glyoxylase-like metal-dependent hydrolase (beta-lactamase superfamily II)
MKRKLFCALLLGLGLLLQSCASTMTSPSADNYRIDTLAKGLWRIQTINDEPGNLSTMYIIEGSAEALIVDTGIGKEGLKDIVYQLLGNKPFKVALTHGHFDHSGGTRYFPEFYLHNADTNIARGIPAGLVSRQRYIDDGTVFDLGDKKIEVITLPGHSPGSVAFFNRADRYIMTGDTINPMVWMQISKVSLTIYLASVKKLEALKEAVDELYVGHHEQESTKLTPQAITDMRILTEKVLDRTINTYYYGSRNTPPGQEAVYGSARLVFDPARLR